MRNTIPCSAERLSLLDPQMIQAVSEASAFQVAHQYLTENRVRLVDANDSQIASAVIGNAGLYEQHIRLKDGHLVSQCSCAVPEEPMCRHCIAVLLEYHREVKTPQSQQASPLRKSGSVTRTDHSVERPSSVLQSSVQDITLSDITKFIEWLQPAMKAVENDQPLPVPPTLEQGKVSTWILAIKSLEDRRRETEKILATLELEIRDRDAHAGRLAEQLRASITELKTVQATSYELEHEVTIYRETLIKLSELTNEVTRYDEQICAVAREILQKGSHFDRLVTSVKEVAEVLTKAAKPTPAQ